MRSNSLYLSISLSLFIIHDIQHRERLNLSTLPHVCLSKRVLWVRQKQRLDSLFWQWPCRDRPKSSLQDWRGSCHGPKDSFCHKWSNVEELLWDLHRHHESYGISNLFWIVRIHYHLNNVLLFKWQTTQFEEELSECERWDCVVEYR